jgi:hypothetical protein
MEHNDIYRILENLDAAQKSVKQLPALFKPPQTSPQLAGPYPGKNATLGYLVGEGDDERKELLTKFKKKQLPQQNLDLAQRVTLDQLEKKNPMTSAVTRRIMNQHPEWITRYGVDVLMQAIDDVTEGDMEWEEIGSSDVSAYVNMVYDQLRDRGGDRPEMDDRRPFAENTLNEVTQGVEHSEWADNVKDAYYPATVRIIKKRTEDGRHVKSHAMMGDKLVGQYNMNTGVGTFTQPPKQGVSESATTEDVVSAVKKKLGDYLQDVATAIKKDPDLMDKLPQTQDEIKAVKTIRTDDGHEIKIHGNEDDGFRISIKNQDLKTAFKNLDEATMACEMYCARRRGQTANADYIEEKTS